MSPARLPPRGAARRQEPQQHCGDPGGEARQHRQTVIESAEKQHHSDQRAVQRRPDAGLIYIVKQLQNMAVTQVGRQFEAVEVMDAAIVVRIVPEMAMNFEEMDV